MLFYVETALMLGMDYFDIHSSIFSVWVWVECDLEAVRAIVAC